MASPLDHCLILVHDTWIPFRDWLLVPSRAGGFAGTEDEPEPVGWGC